MRTPMRELIEWLDSQIESEPLDLFKEPLEQVREKAESLLEKEKEVAVDFAYQCRNVMAADEFAISKWYDETFNTKKNRRTPIIMGANKGERI